MVLFLFQFSTNFFRVLCGTIKDFIVCISEINNGVGDTEFNDMQQDLKTKLGKLLQILQKEDFQMTYQPIKVFCFWSSN